MEVIYLPNYDIVYLGKKAEELGFVRDTLEKVTRLADTLEYLNTNQKIKRDLFPVIKRKDDFELEPAKKLVKAYITDLMVLTKEEKEFLDEFESGEYIPELLFEDKDILDRIKNHPMALWKTRSV